MIIDANNLIAGRIASFAAKKSLLGETITIINSEKAIISGIVSRIKADHKQRREMGTPAAGPFLPRMPDRYLRRIIRGMLPYKKPRGDAAFKRILCYIGVPKEFEGKKTTEVPGASIDKLPTLKYMTVNEICKTMGGAV